MNLVVFLFLILIVYVLVSFAVCGGDIASPSVVFSFSFLFQSVWVLLYAEKWNLGLHVNTFLVISLGVGWFLIISYLTNAFLNRGRHTTKIANNANNITIKCNPVTEILFLFFCVFFLLLYLVSIVRAVGGSFSSFGAISSAIGEYDRLLKFTQEYDRVRMPFLVNQLRIVVIAAGYWFLYVLLHNWLIHKKIRIVEVGIVLCSILTSAVSGSRTPIFMMIVAGVAYGIILIEKKEGKIRVLDLKRTVAVAAVGTVFILAFTSLGRILGRTINYSAMDYLSIYTGAQVKNLDLFLQEPIRTNDIWGSQTFFSLVRTFGEKIGFEGYSAYNLDLPFRSVNGTGLGNVYTTFYPYIYDFGYTGCFILVGIMAVISQVVFQKARNSMQAGSPSIALMVYGMIFGCLLLSFFSNKFYEIIITATMLKYLIFWMFFNFLFTRKLRLFGIKFTY